MKFRFTKKWQLTLIYFIPVFLIFAGFSVFVFYYYSSKIYEIDDIIQDIAFEYEQFEEGELLDEEALDLITDEEWETWSFAQIDEKLQENGYDPIGDSSDPLYYLTPQEIDQKFQDEPLFLDPEFFDEDYGEFEDIEDYPPYISLEQIEEIQNEINESSLIIIISALFGITLLFAFIAHFFASRSVKPLEEAIEKQKRFVSDSSHEIKTPLALIKSEAEVLLRNQKSSIEEYQDFAKNTVEDVNRLDALTDSLLQLARLDQSRHHIKVHNTNVSTVVSHAVDSFMQFAKAKNIHLNAIVPKGVHAMGHKNSLEQVLRIVIDNAIKYSPAETSIDVAIQEENDKVSIVVTDSGVGIPQKELAHIFDRFYRVSKDRHEKGYGLGLAIAKDLMHLQGGDIKINSIEKRGTRVEMKLVKG